MVFILEHEGVIVSSGGLGLTTPLSTVVFTWLLEVMEGISSIE